VTPDDAAREEARLFFLQRDVDVSGVSGTGIVAWGILFPGDVVALRWTSRWPTSVVFHERGIESVEAVHGHDGKTRIVWVDAALRPRATPTVDIRALLEKAHDRGWEDCNERVAKDDAKAKDIPWVTRRKMSVDRILAEASHDGVYTAPSPSTPPARCPTCGSEDPAERLTLNERGRVVDPFLGNPGITSPCDNDAFHAPPAPPACRDVPASSTFRFDPATPPAPVEPTGASCWSCGAWTPTPPPSTPSTPSAGAVEAATLEAIAILQTIDANRMSDWDGHEIDHIGTRLLAFAATARGEDEGLLRECASKIRWAKAGGPYNGVGEGWCDDLLARLDARLAARDEGGKA
jgi:hypothetical protein